MSRDVSPWLATGQALVLGCAMVALAVATPVLAQSNAQGRSSSGSIITVETPVIDEYWVSASRQPGGTIVFDGYAPDAATVEAFGAIEGADTSFLKIGRGASERYRDAVDFGIAALAKMSEGRFALRNETVTLSGIAETSADYLSLLELADQLPSGLTLVATDLEAPRVADYTFSAISSGNGALRLTGLVPSPTVEADLMRAAGAGAVEALNYASGAPTNFVGSANTALSLVRQLEQGSAVLDGTAWLLTGVPKSSADRTRIEAEFASRGLAAQGWSIALSDPPPTSVQTTTAQVAVDQVTPVTPVSPPATAEPVVDENYTFSASRAADGAVVLSGQLPADPALRYFTVITKGDSAAISIADGAPAGFLPSAEIGLRAIMLLTDARLDFAAGSWRLTGAAPDAATRDEILADIAADNAAAWETDIALLPTPEAPVATAAPETSVAATPDIAACRAPLAEFSARNAILFRSGAAVIAPESAPVLDELAGDLAVCPEAVVHIEGHTDADGDDQLNMALSVARAEAVVNALIERKVNPDRLYAVGYGETKPIAANDTAEGKQQNRRIVVTVLDENVLSAQ